MKLTRNIGELLVLSTTPINRQFFALLSTGPSLPSQEIFRNWRLLLATLVCLASLSSRGLGHGGGGDVAVFTTNGQVDIGFAILDDDDINQIAFNPQVGVFQTILVPEVLFGLALSSSEPGLDGNEGDLPANSPLSIHVQELLYWNGSGTVEFSPATGVEAKFFPDFVATDSLGGFHWHPLYGLRDLVDDGQPIPDGVYVTKSMVRVTGLADSDPYYLVTLVDQTIGQADDPEGAAEALGEMVRAYQSNPLMSPEPFFAGKNFSFYAEATQHFEQLAAVPEPSSVWVAGMLGVVLALPRRGTERVWPRRGTRGAEGAWPRRGTRGAEGVWPRKGTRDAEGVREC